MGPAEQKCLSKSYIGNKKRSTLLRHYSRKCGEIKEKTSFKDAYNGTFIEPTPGNKYFIFKSNERRINRNKIIPFSCFLIIT